MLQTSLRAVLARFRADKESKQIESEKWLERSAAVPISTAGAGHWHTAAPGAALPVCAVFLPLDKAVHNVLIHVLQCPVQ